MDEFIECAQLLLDPFEPIPPTTPVGTRIYWKV